ncbi:MAG: hypothetical protein KBH31_03530 [Methanomassiliicoccales archaeon]|nr:hypothetical protein [Methanomassiliicoccales archaeon]
MRGITSRTLLGTLLSWTIIFEGLFALSIAAQASIEGLGTILASTFTLAAAQLTALGIFIGAMWTLKIAFPDPRRTVLVRLFGLLTYLAMVILAMEGLVMVLIAGNVNVEGFGGVGKKWIVLIGAQLFAIAVLSLRLWRLRDIRSVNWLADTLGSLASAMLMLEGLTAIGIAGNATITGLGTVLERTMVYAGAGLFMLGALIFLVWTITSDPWAAPRIQKRIGLGWALPVIVVLGGLIAAAAVAVSTVAGSVTVAGAGSATKGYVVAGIAQLFALGLVSPILWKLSLERLDRRSLVQFIAAASMAMLAFEGVFAMALAANTHIEGIGGILEGTFRLAGAQLLALSVVALSMWIIRDSPRLGGRAKLVVSALSLLSLTVIALEGLAVMVLAGDLRIDDLGGVRERYVLMGGAQMALLASLALLCQARPEGVRALKVAGTAAAFFSVLMLPFALLL